MSWKQTEKVGRPFTTGTGDVFGHADRDSFSRGIRHGHPDDSRIADNGAWIEEHHNFPGWPDAKAKSWPVTTLHVAMPEGREDLYIKLRVKLMAAVDAFVAEEQLEIAEEGGV